MKNSISVEQATYIIQQEALGIDENMLQRVMEFKMPTLDEVMRHIYEQHPEEFQLKMNPQNEENPWMAELERLDVQNKLRDIEWTFIYRKKKLERLQRRLCRYIDVYLATAGLIDLDEYPQVSEDLKELDIDLQDTDSVEMGRKRIEKSFRFVVRQFAENAEKAHELSSYITERMASFPYAKGNFSDDERYGEECLCKIWNPIERDFISSMVPEGFYIEPTEKQIRENDERFWQRVGEGLEQLSYIMEEAFDKKQSNP